MPWASNDLARSASDFVQLIYSEIVDAPAPFQLELQNSPPPIVHRAVDRHVDKWAGFTLDTEAFKLVRFTGVALQDYVGDPDQIRGRRFNSGRPKFEINLP